MTERNRPRVQRIPLWVTVSLAILGGVAVIVASQIYRYAHGTALLLWYIGLGVPIAANLAMAPARQWLTDHYQRVRVDVLTDGSARVPDDSQRAEIRRAWADGTRSELLEHLDGYREPTDVREGRDYVRANDGRGAKIMFPREDRTAEQYREEIEWYVRDGIRYLSAVMEANHVRLGLGLISLRVRSDTDGTLEGVRVRVWIEDEGAELFDPNDIEFPEDIPTNIWPYGTSPSTWGNPFAAGIDLAGITRAVTAAPIDLGDGIEAHEDGGVVFPEFEVRNGETERLPSVGIRFIGEPGTLLTARWTATANNAPGTRTGAFIVETYRAEVQHEELVHRAFDDENEY